MCLITAGLLVILVQSALCEETLLHPCNTQDIDCLSKTTENFLEQTSAGIPQYDIKAIDPLLIPSVEIFAVPGETVYLKNVNVTGLKKLKIKDFKMDIVKKSVLLAMIADTNIESDITVSKADENVDGTFSSQAKLSETATYTYELKPNEKGIEFFTVGNETLHCEDESVPVVTVSELIQKAWFDDAASLNELKKEILCKVADKAYAVIFHNLRASAKIFPKTAYFTNI